jgi:integrase
MRWSDFDGQGLRVQPEKTHEHEAEACYVQCSEPLRDALLAAPRRSEFILTRQDGKPWKDANMLGKAFRRGLVRAGLAETGVRSISMHGLRKRAAKDAAEIGGIAGAMSVTLHKSSKMAAYYAKGADQKRINAKTVEAWGTEARARHNWLPQIVGGTDAKEVA